MVSCPKLLVGIHSTRKLGFCLPEPALAIPDACLVLHRKGQVERVLDHVLLGLFEMCVCVVEAAFFFKKQPRQLEVSKERFEVPIARWYNLESRI